MAKHIGIVLALCSTLAVASKPHIAENSVESHKSSDGSQPAHNSVEWPHFANNNNLQFRYWPGNDWPNHGSHPLSSHNAGEWSSEYGFHNGGGRYSHGFHNQPSNSLEEPSKFSEDSPSQEFPNQKQPNTNIWPSDFSKSILSRSSEEKKNYGFDKPQSQNNFNDVTNLPWFPYNHNTEAWKHPGFFQPHVPYGFPQGNNMPSQQYPPMFGNQNWGRKVNRPDWYNPHFPQIQQANAIFDDMSRRRPIFAPLYPYHFYPYGHHHAHPSNNDEEFETIEARSRNTRYSDEDTSEVLDKKYGQHYHGSHNPNWNGNSDSNQERPFHHGPYLNPFYNAPDNNFSPNDAQSYEILPSPGPFVIIDDDDDNDDDIEHFKIPNILEIIEQWLEEHGKPYHPHHKPDEDFSEEVEGSGDEDIIPLSRENIIPLSKENLVDEELIN